MSIIAPLAGSAATVFVFPWRKARPALNASSVSAVTETGISLANTGNGDEEETEGDATRHAVLDHADGLFELRCNCEVRGWPPL